MMRGCFFPILLAGACLPLRAAELPDLSALKPGDTIRLPSGRYPHPIVLDGLKGTKGKPIRIVAEPGAVLDGTRLITTPWRLWREGIWRTQIEDDIWQLFVGEQLVHVARWPDASFEDGSLWRMTQCMRSADGGYNKRKEAFFGRCEEGLIYDAPFKSHTGKAGFHEGDSRYEVTGEQQSLAESGKDFTGAVAVLNIGHWLTWARRITEHSPGTDHFRHETGKEQTSLQRFFAWYVLGLAALDRPNEWWFDATNKTAYYMPPPGQDPNTMELRGRTQDFAIDLQNCAHLTFEGLDIFGAGFWIRDCEGISFENCRFRFSATNKWVLGEFKWFAFFNPVANANKMPVVRGGKGNRFANCQFAFCNAPLYFGSEGTVVENCLFHDIEWDLNSNGASGAVVIGKDCVFRRNTVWRTGNSEGIRALDSGARIELCRAFDMGNLQHDGAAINVGTRNQIRAVVTRNWAHDANRQGIRFDYHGTNILREDGQIHGDGVYTRNVTWNTQPSQVKGDRHLILNNTVVNVNSYPDPEKELMNMSVQGFKSMHEIEGNANSLTRNNLANLSHRSWNLKPRGGQKGWWTRKDGYKQPGPYVIPGVCDHNMREPGAAYTYLRDPQNLDLRPKGESPLVDGGQSVAAAEVRSPVARFEDLTFLGTAPDIGAYEHGDKRYWIPGCQLPQASTPVPPDGAVGVKQDADLMFLEAYQCTYHRVWFGTDAKAMTLIADLEDDTTNIVTPPKLRPGITYCWRVDAARGGETEPGQVWRFRTK
ncbi:MAG: hypothetical protein HN742_16560 [Lentisphaerae bacterium]|jgi:hypothetical protein|nr:hypothetical protein [Lentisphaerota bacterium]MBT4821058.1 hypothetical protein [Lentisphaerota bacterium]MBT5609381.1 hypothetical protein [Lentisphaerota bacterium]MBT7060793.1 hypothetical protein [Lentisphaerota bacterium]MBT7843492.1 hypothetical protein [Lentisphaerota bacterium]